MLSTRRDAKTSRSNLANWLLTAGAYWDRNAWGLSAAIAILSVFIATRLNQNIGYANDALCDPWYFFGINQAYFHLRAILGDEYQFDRYPAILPWIFLGPRLSAVALTEVKFWTYFLIASGSFLYAAVKLLGHRIGPLVAILFLCSTSFLAALSTDFVTAAGLAWECAFIASTIRAGTAARPAPWCILSGVFCACCVYSHIPMIMFIFSTPLYFLLRASDRTIKELISAPALLVVGFLATTISLGLASLQIGGNFLFFKHELLTALLYVAKNIYARPMTDTFQWFSFDALIPIFLLAAAFSAVTLGWLRFQGSVMKSLNLALPAVIYLAAAALCFGFEFSGRMVLQEGVFAPWLLPPAFLAIGSTLSVAGSPGRILSISLALTAACVLTWMACRLNPEIDYPWRYILAGAALLSLVLPWRVGSLALATGCILALLSIDYPSGYGYLSWDRMHGNGREIYRLVKRADQFIANYSGSTSPVFWVSGATAAPDDPLFVAIAAPRSFLKCNDFAASFPNLEVTQAGFDPTFPDLPTAVRNHYIAPGHQLFIIARGRDLVITAADALHSVGLKATPLAEMELAPGISIAAAAIQQ